MTKTTKKTTIKTGTLYRDGTIVARAAPADGGEDDRLVDVAFSSEAAVDRWFGKEILDHAKKSVDLSRFMDGRGPVLMHHDPRDQIGVVETPSIDSDRVGRATVRLGKGARAEEILADIRDRIITSVSVGYRINKMVQEESEPENPIFRATDWTPLEISFVSVPADASVGVGRGEADGHETIIVESEVVMPDPTPNPEPANRADPAPAAAPAASAPAQAASPEPAPVDAEKLRAETLANEGKRRREIIELGARHNKRELAEKHVDDGTSIEVFRHVMLTTIGLDQELYRVPTDLGMSPKDQKSYSIRKAINALVSRKNGGDPTKIAPFEMECSAELEKRIGGDAQGILLPMDLMKRTVLTVGGATTGADLVGTDLLAASFIDRLHNRMKVRQLGGQVLSGLVGNIAIPRMTAGVAMTWISAEDGDATEANPTFDQVTMSPKTAAAYTEYTRDLLLQSTPSVDAMIENDLILGMALGLDSAAINGSGSSGQPKGIRNQTGVGVVQDAATGGGALDWGKVVDLETAVSQDNADIGTLAYLTNAKVRGSAKQIEKASSTGQFIWPDTPGINGGDGSLNGYLAAVSNQVPSNLTKGAGTALSAAIFGNWADLIIAEWGVFDMLIDPYTNSLKGRTRIVVFQSIDIAVRHGESFSKIEDLVTT